MTFPFDPEKIKKLMEMGLNQKQAEGLYANILHESASHRTFQIDYIHNLPIEATSQGDLVIETKSGDMWIHDKGKYVQITGTAQTAVKNKNPFDGKGKSYADHVENGWGSAFPKSDDWERNSDYF